MLSTKIIIITSEQIRNHLALKNHNNKQFCSEVFLPIKKRKVQRLEIKKPFFRKAFTNLL